MGELVRPLRCLAVSEAEYALLHVLCLCTPVSSLSNEGEEIVRTAKNKYLSVFSDIVGKSLNVAAFNDIIERIGQLMMLLPAAERVGHENDTTLAMMSMFNYAGLQGNLTWDLHVKKCT
ncbi:NHR-34 protein [Aphelenchoides avenae]|nr:NHR-34 protein [Aphelenchus avenae]